MRTKTTLGRVCALAVLLGLAGCYKATFYQNPHAYAGAQHERWMAFFIFGLVGAPRVDVREFCGPDEVAEVRTGSNFATGLVSALTIGIYTPHKVYVTCAAGSEHTHANRSTQRRLELALDRHGVPVAAELHTASGVSSARLEKTGPERFQVSGSKGDVL
jgi:hypothetical protein